MIKKKKDLGICLRCTAMCVNGSSQKMTATEVVEAHMNHAEQSADRCVVWSTNVKIHMNYVGRIGKVILFSDIEGFYVEADVEKIISFKDESVPDTTLISNEWIPCQFPEPRKTWIVLSNIREVERGDLSAYKVLNDSIMLDEQVLRSRFSMVYFV